MCFIFSISPIESEEHEGKERRIAYAIRYSTFVCPRLSCVIASSLPEPCYKHCERLSVGVSCESELLRGTVNAEQDTLIEKMISEQEVLRRKGLRKQRTTGATMMNIISDEHDKRAILNFEISTTQALGVLCRTLKGPCSTFSSTFSFFEILTFF